MSITIRNIEKKDRNEICLIAFQTAFLGSSGSWILDDANLFFDISCLYFLLFERENSFVAIENDKVVGYLLGTCNMHRYFLVNTWIILPFIVLPKLLACKYRIRSKTICFFFLLILESLLNRIPRASTKKYPAELHINLSEEARGKGIASLLMKKLMDTLTKANIRGVQLNTTSENKAALKLYFRFDFVESSRKDSYLWSRLMGSSVENITLVKQLVE